MALLSGPRSLARQPGLESECDWLLGITGLFGGTEQCLASELGFLQIGRGWLWGPRPTLGSRSPGRLGLLSHAQLTELFQTRLDMETVGPGLEQPQALLLAKCPEQPLPRCVLRSWCPLGILAHGQSVCKAEEDATKGGWLSPSIAHWGLLYTPRFSLTWVGMLSGS